jgi:hypothetical protein
VNGGNGVSLIGGIGVSLGIVGFGSVVEDETADATCDESPCDRFVGLALSLFESCDGGDAVVADVGPVAASGRAFSHSEACFPMRVRDLKVNPQVGQRICFRGRLRRVDCFTGVSIAC